MALIQAIIASGEALRKERYATPVAFRPAGLSCTAQSHRRDRKRQPTAVAPTGRTAATHPYATPGFLSVRSPRPLAYVK